MAKEFKGTLNFHGSNDDHGIVWSLVRDGTQVHETIEAGDHLVVYGPNEAVLFSDIIKPDCQAGFNPEHGQQEALGWYIHWVQEGWKADDWATLFMQYPKLRAKLIKL